MLVQNLLENAAAFSPNKVALICGQQRLTYNQINRFAEETAAALISMGLQTRDRVVVFQDNSVEAVISIFAILKAGGIFVVLHPETKPRKLAYILRDSAARMIISQANKVETVGEAFAKGPITAICRLIKIKKDGIRLYPDGRIADILLEQHISHEEVSLRTHLLSDLAALIYTSGSTGQPKAVMSAHCNMIAAIESITKYLENGQNDVILNVLPLSFDYGLYQILMAFFVGGTIVLEKTFSYPYKAVQLITAEKVTGFPIVPAMAAMLLRLEQLGTYDFSSLRYITNTGAHMPTAYIGKLQSFLPHVKIFCMYGLTECKRVSYLPPDMLSEKAGSVGRPMANVKVFIVDENGQEVEQGKVGELVVRGPNVMRGYWNDTLQTACKFRSLSADDQICLFSGDLFKMDSEGFLYFVGRKDDLLKVKGERVSPKEIESVLCELEGISEAAVIGLPDALYGHRLKAVIVKKDGADLLEQAVLNHCVKNLESHMIPKHFEFIDALPRTNNCKVDKNKLK